MLVDFIDRDCVEVPLRVHSGRASQSRLAIIGVKAEQESCGPQMQLFKVDATTGAKRSIARMLLERFDVNEEIEGVYRVAGGGTNDDRHVVIKTQGGRKFGIKTRSRGGGPNGERREAAFSGACQALGLTEACRVICVERIHGLSGFDTEECSVTEWVPDSKQVGEISPEEKQELTSALMEIIAQVARWMAVNLHLGLADRGGLKNWVWAHTRRRLVAVDTESAWQNGTIADHFGVIDAFYDRRSLKAERGQSDVSMAFERALREMHSLIQTRADVISQAVQSVESARHYSSPYLSMSEDEFADWVFAGIA